MNAQEALNVEATEESTHQLTEDTLNDALFVATLRRAMADVMTDESKKDKKLFDDALAEQKEVDGKRVLEISWPNGEVIASQSETVTEQWQYTYHDREAFNIWLQEHYPDYFEDTEVEVEETYTEAGSGIPEVDALLDQGYTSITVKRNQIVSQPDGAMVTELLDDADIEEGVIYDPETDEEIPGVTGGVEDKTTKSGFRFKNNLETKRQLVQIALTSGIPLTNQQMFTTLELEPAEPAEAQ